MEYPKTENLYARDPETHEIGPAHGFRQPEVNLISHWLVTEKVDGMNMRVIWTPGDPTYEDRVAIFGRTDRAQIPGDLYTRMEGFFTDEALRETFAVYPPIDGDGHIRYPEQVVLFGEGFGPGIQGAAGQAYGGEKRFILFDVVVDGHWLGWEDVQDVACKLGVPTVPVLCYACSLENAKAAVDHRYSQLLGAGSEHVEGIVARTEPYLFDGRGRPLKFKYKVRDL